MMKALTSVAVLIVFVLSATTANATFVSETFSSVFSVVDAGGSSAVAVGKSLDITLSYETTDFTTVTAGVYTAAGDSVSLSFSADGGAEAFDAASFGSIDLMLVVNSVQDTLTLLDANASVSWTFRATDSDGSALTGTALPTDLSGFAAVGTLFELTGLTEPSGGGTPSFKSFQAIAVPEPSSFLFGGLVFGIVGIGRMVAKKRLAKTA